MQLEAEKAALEAGNAALEERLRIANDDHFRSAEGRQIGIYSRVRPSWSMYDGV